jgi:hypothetical protein
MRPVSGSAPEREPAESVLTAVVVPALERALAALREPGADRPALSADLAAAAEDAQRRLGERARDSRLHRIVGAAASAAMALALPEGMVPAADIRAHLEAGLRLLRGDES